MIFSMVFQGFLSRLLKILWISLWFSSDRPVLSLETKNTLFPIGWFKWPTPKIKQNGQTFTTEDNQR